MITGLKPRCELDLFQSGDVLDFPIEVRLHVRLTILEFRSSGL